MTAECLPSRDNLQAEQEMQCQGPAPAGSRDTLRMNGVGKRDESKRREKKADIPWFTQKANKAPARDLFCSRRPQVPSRIEEGAPP